MKSAEKSLYINEHAKKIIEEASQTKQELARIETEELKATKTTTVTLNGINSFLGGSKVNRQKKENK